MMQNETSAAPAIARVEEFPTTTRYHVEGARVIEMDGKRYAADFVDVDKLNRNYAHRGPRIGVHLQRLTKSNAAYRDGQSEWVWSFDGVHDESIAELVALVGGTEPKPRPSVQQGNPEDLQAGDYLGSVNGVALGGTEGLLVEDVRRELAAVAWGARARVVTVWFGHQMVELNVDGDADVLFRRGA